MRSPPRGCLGFVDHILDVLDPIVLQAKPRTMATQLLPVLLLLLLLRLLLLLLLNFMPSQAIPAEQNIISRRGTHEAFKLKANDDKSSSCVFGWLVRCSRKSAVGGRSPNKCDERT